MVLKSILDKYLTAIEQGIGYVDSTKIITCSNHWNSKIHRESSYGYSSTGNFKGFKLTVLINDKKLISNYCITTASTHDLAILQDNKLFDKQNGLIYGDSGYVSKDFYEECKINNIEFVSKPRNNMNPYFDWEKYKGFYKGRLKIERLFSIFKTRMNMNVSTLHSTKALYTRIYSTLASWQLLKLDFFKYRVI